MREPRSGRVDPRQDDPPTEPIPVVPAQPHGFVPAGLVPVEPAAAGPVVEGVLLSDLESEYVARHMAHQRKTASHGVESHGGQRAAVEVRRPAPVARRPDAAPVLRRAASAVRRGTGRVGPPST
jgi:hypothetical protein